MDLYNHLLSRNYCSQVSGYPWIGEDTITFPLFSFDKKLVGYQQYRPNGNKTARKDPKLGKYFTYLPKGASGVWGLESLHLSPNIIIICEGIYKACRFHVAGYSAIAVLGNNPIHLKQQLELLSLTSTLIVVPDPDKAGLKLIRYGQYNLVPKQPIDDLSPLLFNNFLNDLKGIL